MGSLLRNPALAPRLGARSAADGGAASPMDESGLAERSAVREGSQAVGPGSLP